MMNMIGMGMSGGFFGFTGLLLLVIAGYIGYRLLHRLRSEERTRGGGQSRGETFKHRIY